MTNNVTRPPTPPGPPGSGIPEPRDDDAEDQVLGVMLTDPRAAADVAEILNGDDFTITAIGRPITQGSKTRTRWGMRDANGDRLHPWRDAVTAAAIDAIGDAPPIEGPVNVTLAFAFARPAGHYGTGRNAAALKPSAPSHPISLRIGDLDKLCRAVCDSLTEARVWLDDSQVANLAAAKEWCGRGEREGVTIHVVPLSRVQTPPVGPSEAVRPSERRTARPRGSSDACPTCGCETDYPTATHIVDCASWRNS